MSGDVTGHIAGRVTDHMTDPVSGSAAGREGGFVAGLEALAFGVLIFVIGTLVILGGWAVMDAKYASSAAAREAVRAVVRAPVDASTDELEQRAQLAAHQAVAAHGHAPEATTLTVEHPPLALERCREVSITVHVEVGAVVVPGFVDTARWTVGSRHQQLVDPFRSGLPVDEGHGCGG